MEEVIGEYRDSLYKISQNQLKNCRVFSDRYVALKELIPNHIDYLEIGVLAGDYTEVVLMNKDVKSATLLDTFKMYDWARKEPQRFTEDGHLDFIKNRFKHYENVFLEIGNSIDLLPLKEKKFDYIYIDADHRFKYIHNDLLKSISMCRPNAIVGINDFMLTPKRFQNEDRDADVWSVTNMVCQFLRYNQNWEIIGLALDDSGIFDVYLKQQL
jgi:hypothetical protein